MFKNPQKLVVQITRKVMDLEWRLLLLLLLPLSLIVFVSLSTTSSLSSLSIFGGNSTRENDAASSPRHPYVNFVESLKNRRDEKRKAELDRSRIAVCLVGGARRFELTGESIVEKILKVYPSSDLFLHSPLDQNSYKLSILKDAPRIAAVKIFKQERVPETESQVRVLTADNSPNGIQGLLQYFNLVEGCITLIRSYQAQKNFTYDWIVRTRVDGYWSSPLSPDNFLKGQYVVPPGSSYGGLNDRFGAGDFDSSVVALSRLSLIPELNSSGFYQLNSERAFKAQLTVRKIPYTFKRLPFCIVTDRRYDYPPARFGVPVAALSSHGPLSGAKCRPCTVVSSGPDVGNVMSKLDRGWSWTEWANGTMDLCDASGEWETGWQRLFDRTAGKKLAAVRKRAEVLKVKECVANFEDMRRRSAIWEAPPPLNICELGLSTKS
ncbi:hypothetical protein DCAR_0417066 [Daucus carota subsp. sativus]|uniref:DUF7796 domain-containing protein n=2 Tax=Daucus carota subsp. sativus TaxID=79200 RepID=A0AAF1AZ52_DAUCS|nr:hypothetical protein DCAR_0417066 [Daucus carota subsp. sativus]